LICWRGSGRQARVKLGTLTQAKPLGGKTCETNSVKPDDFARTSSRGFLGWGNGPAEKGWRGPELAPEHLNMGKGPQRKEVRRRTGKTSEISKCFQKTAAGDRLQKKGIDLTGRTRTATQFRGLGKTPTFNRWGKGPDMIS